MKYLQKLFILSNLFLIYSQVNLAQVRIKHNPFGEEIKEIKKYKKSKTKYSAQIKKLPTFNYDSLLRVEEMEQLLGLPFRFGKAIDVNYSTTNSGQWELIDGYKVWKLIIFSEEAYSLNLKFKKFYLPKGASLIIYNEAKDFLFGPILNRNNKGNEKFITGPIRGDKIIIELVVPNNLSDKLKLQIDKVIHGYKNILWEEYGEQTTYSCHNNVSCFSDWDDESGAIAKLIMGEYLCSGSLINNANNNYRPYLLTAFHCVDLNSNGDINISEFSSVDDWVIHVNYKKSCNGSSLSYVELNGADYLAGWNDTDFALVELDESIVGIEGVKLLGWDNRNNIPTSATIIHHPAGAEMKITFDFDDLSSNSQQISWRSGLTSPVNTHWVSVPNSGTLEGGSSGSPLFNQNSRVIGQLHGGLQGCPPSTFTKYFGQLHESWDGNNTNNSQLSHWLDPDNLNISFTNLIESPYISSSSIICYSGSTCTLLNPPPNVSITWGGTNVAYPNGNTGTSVTVRALNQAISGNATITASFTADNQQYVAEKNVWVGKPAKPVTIPAQSSLTTAQIGSIIPVNIISVEGGDIDDGQWSASGTISISSPLMNPGSSMVFDANAAGYGFWYVNVSNNCGTSYNTSGTVNVSSSGGGLPGGLFSLNVSPNPTSSETEAELIRSDGEPLDDNTIWEVEIYDLGMKLKSKSKKIYDKKYKIKTHSWKEGIYIIRAYINDEIVTTKFIKE